MKWVAAILAFFALALFFILKLFFGRPADLKQASGLPIYGEIPAFNLQDRTGSRVGLEDLKGKIWIADFIFTRCSGICPLVTTKMRKLQDEFAEDPDIRFVSFSVDPEHDTPQVLALYSARFKADPHKWYFLTGDKKSIYTLAERHFYLGVSEIPEEERPARDQAIRHSSKFALVDRDGKIRGFYDTEGESETAMQTLIQDAKSLLQP